jgi:hypothetical protein
MTLEKILRGKIDGATTLIRTGDLYHVKVKTKVNTRPRQTTTNRNNNPIIQNFTPKISVNNRPSMCSGWG